MEFIDAIDRGELFIQIEKVNVILGIKVHDQF